MLFRRSERSTASTLGSPASVATSATTRDVWVGGCIDGWMVGWMEEGMEATGWCSGLR